MPLRLTVLFRKTSSAPSASILSINLSFALIVRSQSPAKIVMKSGTLSPKKNKGLHSLTASAIMRGVMRMSDRCRLRSCSQLWWIAYQLNVSSQTALAKARRWLWASTKCTSSIVLRRQLIAQMAVEMLFAVSRMLRSILRYVACSRSRASNAASSSSEKTPMNTWSSATSRTRIATSAMRDSAKISRMCTRRESAQRATSNAPAANLASSVANKVSTTASQLSSLPAPSALKLWEASSRNSRVSEPKAMITGRGSLSWPNDAIFSANIPSYTPRNAN